MLNSRFDMKDLELVDVILAIKIKRTLDGLILSQYIMLTIFLESLTKIILI